MRWLPAGLLVVLMLSAVGGSPLAVVAEGCQRQIPDGPTATYIVEYRGMTCSTARKIVLTGDRKRWNDYKKPIDGLHCRPLNIPAGGGEAVCTAPHRFLKVAFE